VVEPLLLALQEALETVRYLVQSLLLVAVAVAVVAHKIIMVRLAALVAVVLQ